MTWNGRIVTNGWVLEYVLKREICEMDNPQEFRFFDAADYVVFSALLIASAMIGVFFAFCAKRKQNTTAEYLLGSKEMGIFPLSMSLCAR